MYMNSSSNKNGIGVEFIYSDQYVMWVEIKKKNKSETTLVYTSNFKKVDVSDIEPWVPTGYYLVIKNKQWCIYTYPISIK